MKRTLLAGLILAPAVALAQAWPAKPVRAIVPFSAGTAADTAARQPGSRLSEAWGQCVVIENVMDAGGNIGAANVAKASGAKID